MMDQVHNIPEGVIGTMVAWLTHRVYTMEARLDAISAAVGAAKSKPSGKATSMLLVIAGVWLACSVAGCASISQTAVAMETGTNGMQIVRETKNRMIATGSAKAIVEKLKVSAGKTSSIGAESMESTSTNDSASTLDSLTRLLQSLRK